MYDKKKTIKGYMGGGYMKPMGYQTGGYIPGLSSSRFGLGLRRDARIAEQELEENAKKLLKENRFRGLLGKIGSIGGSLVGGILAAPTGGLSVLAGKAIGTGVGKALGEVAGGSFVDTENLKKSSTGLYKDDFDYLEKQGKKAQDFGSLVERSIGSGAATYAGGKFTEGLGRAKDYFTGTKLDLGEIAGEDLLTKDGLARTTGLGGDSFAERVRSQALLDNPELAEEFSGAGLDLADMPESDFLDTLGNVAGESASQQPQGLDFSNAPMVDMEAILSMAKTKNMMSDEMKERVNTGAASLLPTEPRTRSEMLMARNKNLREMFGSVSNAYDQLPFDYLMDLSPYQYNIRGQAEGGYVQGYKDGGMTKDKRGMDYFNREFPKDSFKAMIQEAVYNGELDPREGLQHILNKQQKDFMKSKGDTSNVLYRKLQEAGYSKGGNIEEYEHGGLINMNSYARRIL